MVILCVSWTCIGHFFPSLKFFFFLIFWTKTFCTEVKMKWNNMKNRKAINWILCLIKTQNKKEKKNHEFLVFSLAVFYYFVFFFSFLYFFVCHISKSIAFDSRRSWNNQEYISLCIFVFRLVQRDKTMSNKWPRTATLSNWCTWKLHNLHLLLLFFSLYRAFSIFFSLLWLFLLFFSFYIQCIFNPFFPYTHSKCIFDSFEWKNAKLHSGQQSIAMLRYVSMCHESLSKISRTCSVLLVDMMGSLIANSASLTTREMITVHTSWSKYTSAYVIKITKSKKKILNKTKHNSEKAKEEWDIWNGHFFLSLCSFSFLNFLLFAQFWMNIFCHPPHYMVESNRIMIGELVFGNSNVVRDIAIQRKKNAT